MLIRGGTPRRRTPGRCPPGRRPRRRGWRPPAARARPHRAPGEDPLRPFEDAVPLPQGRTVKLTKSSSLDPQDTGLEPAVNPPCWGSETAVSLNLTIPGRRQWPAAAVCGHRWPVYGSQPPPRSRGPGHRARRPASRALLGERSADNDVCEPAHLIPPITSMAASRRRVGTEQARLV